jgi:peptide chain release factor 1
MPVLRNCFTERSAHRHVPVQRLPGLHARPVVAPHLAARSRSSMVCRALESYMSDKLKAAESMFKELQLRMADPEIAASASEFQKVRSWGPVTSTP